MTNGCGAPAQGGTIASDTTETVLEGKVLNEGTPVGGAFVRLLDSTGEFTAEVVSSPEGDFRFFAAPAPGPSAHCTARATARPTSRRPAPASTRWKSRSPDQAGVTRPRRNTTVGAFRYAAKIKPMAQPRRPDGAAEALFA